MKKLALAFTVTIAAHVYAGTKSIDNVSINSPGKYAWGSLGTARNSLDGNQYIECFTYASTDARWGYCYARDASATTVTCFASATHTNGNAILDVMASVSSDSWIRFAWDDTGNCRSVKVLNSSRYAPKSS